MQNNDNSIWAKCKCAIYIKWMVKINYSGSTGYVSSQYLQSTKPSSSSSSNSGSTSVSSSASSVIAYAKTLLGKPYVGSSKGQTVLTVQVLHIMYLKIKRE